MINKRINDLRVAYRNIYSIKRKDNLKIIILGLTFFLFADLGLVSSLDAFIFLFLAALIKPRQTPYLLILVSSLQDARGLAYFWSYMSFVTISMIMIVFYSLEFIYKRNNRCLSFAQRHYQIIVACALTVIIYALFNSFWNNALGGHSQDSERSFYSIAILMCMMVISAYVSIDIIINEDKGIPKLYYVAVIAIFHMIAISMLQIFFNPEIFRSSEKIIDIEESAQLMMASVLGFPRINSTYLSPNAFGLAMAVFLLLLLSVSKFNKIRLGFVFMYGIMGIYVSVLSMSKTITAYFISTTCVLYYKANSRLKKLITVMIVAALLGLVVYMYYGKVIDLLVIAFRYKGADIGTRGDAWSSIVEEFSVYDWIVGTGLSYWPIFLKKHVGIGLSDPHSMVLSIPGTFGLIGVFFYFIFTLSLFNVYSNKSTPEVIRSLVLCLILLFYGKDLASIPYLFGNTPITYLLWMVIGLIFYSSSHHYSVSARRASV